MLFSTIVSHKSIFHGIFIYLLFIWNYSHKYFHWALLIVYKALVLSWFDFFHTHRATVFQGAFFSCLIICCFFLVDLDLTSMCHCFDLIIFLINIFYIFCIFYLIWLYHFCCSSLFFCLFSVPLISPRPHLSSESLESGISMRGLNFQKWKCTALGMTRFWIVSPPSGSEWGVEGDSSLTRLCPLLPSGPTSALLDTTPTRPHSTLHRLRHFTYTNVRTTLRVLGSCRFKVICLRQFL